MGGIMVVAGVCVCVGGGGQGGVSSRNGEDYYPLPSMIILS